MNRPAARARARPAVWPRLLLLLLGVTALLPGLGGGLARLGWTLPDAVAAAAAWHGPLMVCGFFGLLISLERAVALGAGWPYAGPVLTGAGTLALLLAGPAAAAPGFVAGSAVLVAATWRVWARQPEPFVVVLALGAMAWAGGNLLWAAGAAVHEVAPWWIAFLVLTIAGERLELSRFLAPDRRAMRAFHVLMAVIVAALLITLPAAWPAAGLRLFGGALLALSAWLLRHDLARRTVRQRGLTRFIAVCLISGYVWLALGGAVLLWAGLAPGTASYDAALHALLLGFVFSMVFGHAPIVAPSLLRVAVPYGRRFYAPLVLLHASLLLRLLGDALQDFSLRHWGALGSALAIAAFLLTTVGTILAARRQGPAHRVRQG